MKILIIKLGAIGDIIHTLPSLASLRRAMPRAHLAWIVERGAAATILRDHPLLDELIEIDSRRWRRSLFSSQTWSEIGQVAARLRDARYDLTLDFQGLIKSAFIGYRTHAGRRIGFAKAALREPESAIFLTERVAVDDHSHIIEKNLSLVRHLGVPTDGRYEFPVSIAAAEAEFADALIGELGARPAIINPGGGWPTKLWPTDGYARIVDLLWTEYGLRSAITFGPGEEGLAQRVIEQSRSGAGVAVQSTLKQYYALARRASIFVGGDTGPMHLAAAAGAPVVGLFGPSSARRNGPFAKGDRVVERTDLECRIDCYRRSCGHTLCMRIPVAAVWEQVERVILEQASSPLRESERA